jgi:hypothetical protein
MFIGVTGKARSGKDTFAAMLAGALFDTTGRRFVLAAFAQELKLRVQRDFDLDHEQLWGDDKEVPDQRYRKGIRAENDPEPYWTSREILQNYGQFYRTIDGNFWVNNLFRVLAEKEIENAIITDVRHPNEGDPIIDKGGYMIKVTSARNDLPGIHGAEHISEIAMDDYNRIDFTVVNDWGLEELTHAAKDVARFLIDSENMKENLEGKNG